MSPYTEAQLVLASSLEIATLQGFVIRKDTFDAEAVTIREKVRVPSSHLLERL